MIFLVKRKKKMAVFHLVHWSRKWAWEDEGEQGD